MDYKKIEFLENLSLFDSQLKMINICNTDNIVQIEILLQLGYPNNLFVKLIFKDIISFDFYWNNQYNFYTIASYKLFTSENEIYCSLDPYDDSSIINDEDCDVIRSTSIEVYYSSDTNFKELKKTTII